MKRVPCIGKLPLLINRGNIAIGTDGASRVSVKISGECYKRFITFSFKLETNIQLRTIGFS